MIPTEHSDVNKEPANRLIDIRFDKVKDWKKYENDSKNNKKTKKNSTFVIQK